MKRKSRRYKLLLAVHKYLGLVTGLIVFLVSITGACWAFQEEIMAWSAPEYRFDGLTHENLLPASRAKEIGEAVFPGREIHGALYSGPDRPVEVIFYQADPDFYRSAFLHPATGELLHTEDRLSGFFAWVLRGHMYLWLPPGLGSPIVKYGVLVFLLILISGVLIWLNGKRRQLRVCWKPTTGWRRKNYDLHSIGGVYLGGFALLFALTGSVIGLPWFYNLTYQALGGEGDPSFVIPENVHPAPAGTPFSPAYDELVPRLMAEEPEATGFELHYPRTDGASIYVEVERHPGTYYASDYRYFDQYSLEEISSPGVYATYAEADLAKFVLRLNYDIHVGAIGGFAGKLIAFLASLLIATLPVTGLLLWYGRRFKKPRRMPPGPLKLPA